MLATLIWNTALVAVSAAALTPADRVRCVRRRPAVLHLLWLLVLSVVSAMRADLFGIRPSNSAKEVPRRLLVIGGGVVGVEMARGAVAHRRAQVSVAITGIAGPGGGSEDKPVGTVWLAWYRFGGRIATHEGYFDGDRDEVRRAAVMGALDGMIEFLQ
jgi:hypothetical protein